jgi:small subunit ribosomal protein S1
MADLKKLLEDKTYLAIPKEGDIVKGKIFSISKNEIRIDIDGYKTGIVRGPELRDESSATSELKVGDEVEATVIDLENENGEVELSLRYAGHKRAWDKLAELMKTGEIISVKITEANKGGLMLAVNRVTGFLPVSQLSPDNYPRVPGGEKQKILEKLRSLIGKSLNVRVIDVNEQEGKLIVSEKAVWEERQKEVISKYKVGDTVEAEITALTDFGAFVKFDNLEGLIHISELAWQRIDHPSEVVKVGDKALAKIVGIDGSKIFLSLKQLAHDPWKNINERYKVGQIVKGKILKSNPFGFFVELDPEIHGLAHISELAKKPVKDIGEIGKPGDEMEFKIVSIEPEQHRLGLSLKDIDETAPAEEKKEESSIKK